MSGGKKGVRGARLQLEGEESTGKTHTMGRSVSCPALHPAPHPAGTPGPELLRWALREEPEGTDNQHSVNSAVCRGDEAGLLSPPEPLSTQS